jgi:hypothetical protein
MEEQMGIIKTTDAAHNHAKAIGKISLSKVHVSEISYTNVGDIKTGQSENEESYQLAEKVKSNLSEFSNHIDDAANLKQAQDVQAAHYMKG